MKLKKTRKTYNPKNKKDPLYGKSTPNAVYTEEVRILSGSLLNSIIDQCPCSMWISDNQGTLIRINQACLDLLNIKMEEVLYKYNILKDNIVEEQGYLPLVKRVFEAGETARFEIRYDTSKLRNMQLDNSASVILDVTVFPVKNTKGKITNAVIQHIDITKHKLYEESLRESEERYHRILENGNDAIFINSIRDDGMPGPFTEVNEMACKMLGYTREELMQMTPDDIDAPEMKDRILEVRALIKEKGRYIFEMLHVARNGKRILVEINAHLFLMNGKQMVMSIARDITKRKRIEENLRESEERFRAFMDNSPAIAWTKDEHGRYIYLNRAFERRFGIRFADYAGKTDFEVWPRETAEMFRKNDLKVLKGERSIEAEEQTQNPDGSFSTWHNFKFLFRDASGMRYIGGIGIDITARKLAEQALIQSEGKYRDIFERSIQGIFQCTPDGKFINVNPSYAHILGYDSPKELVSEIISIKDKQYVNPEDYSFFIETIRDTGKIEGFEHQLYKKDGSMIWISTNARIEYAPDGKMLYYEGIIEDITRRKHAEEEKERLQSLLRQSQKMEAIGTFIGGIAHDFNNILNVLIGYTNLLQMELDKNNPLYMYVEQISLSTEKAASLTRSLLTFSRKQPTVLKPINLNGIIKDIEKLLKRLLPEDIALNIILDSKDIIITGDSSQIDQILFNLATNARDAMPKGGIISIEIKLLELESEFTEILGYGKPGKYALIIFSDNGTGMDANTREHLFDPFFTTKDIGKGTGLGMSTVYGIVKQHGGYINVYSEPGCGTIYNIYFPASPADYKEEKPPPSILKHGRETILIAEDNDSVRHLMKIVLTKYGYTVIEAVDGEDAIDKYNKYGNIDLLILDSVMPKKNGREVYDEISKTNAKVKVLFCSGYTRDVALDKGIEEKEFDFMLKPLTPNAMLEKVRDILDRQ